MPVVHSPIRGVHPNLFEGVMTFVKYVGSDDEPLSLIVKKHLEALGIVAVCCASSRTTELGKLLSTTYYGLVIAWHGEMKKMCDELNIDFNEAVTAFNTTYNEGYAKLGHLNVQRPVLYPPDGTIGGHCVIPNAEFLKELHPSKALETILEYKKKC